MVTTISDLEMRLDLARTIQAEYTGQSEDGLDVERIGEYTLVHDGNDRWLAESDDYDLSLETIIGDICDGYMDKCEDADIYSTLCSMTGCLFSRLGISLYSEHDLAENLDCSDEQRSEILDWLGIEVDSE